MKKKKKFKKNYSPMEQKEKFSLKNKITNVLQKRKSKDFFIIFISVFLISLFITLQYKPLKTHQSPGDSFYYYKNSVAFSQVWRSPFYYVPKLLFHSLTKQELYSIGFNYNSDFDSFFRAPGYNTYLSFWIFLFGKSEVAALLSQIFLFALILSFLFLILRYFINRKLSFIIVFLSLFYLSFYIMIIQTMTELFQTLSFLILGFYSFILFKNNEKNKKRHYFLLALFLIITIYSKMSNKFLWIFLVPLFIGFEFFKSHSIKTQLKKNITIFLISFFLLFGLGQWVLSQGQKSSSNLGGWRNYYAGSCLQSDGFVINTLFHNKEFRDNIKKGKEQFWFNRYSEICKYALLNIIKNKPFAYAGMTLKKISLVLTHPPTNNANYPLLAHLRHYLNFYHFILIFFVITTSFFLGENFFLLKSYFFIILLYLSGLFGLSNPDSRYFWPLIPFYFLFSTVGIKYFFDKKILKQKKFFLFFILLAIFLIFNKNILASIFQNYIFVSISILIFFLFSFTFFFKWLFASYSKKQQPSFYLHLIILLFIFFLTLPFVVDNKSLNHFTLKSKQIKTVISIPTALTNNTNTFFCIIDVQGKQNAQLHVQINNTWETNCLLADTSQSLNSNIKQKFNIGNKPHWLIIPVSHSIIQKTNTISVTLQKGHLFYTLKEKYKKLPSPFYYKPNIDDLIFGPFSKKDQRLYMETKIESLTRKSFINKKYSKKDINIFLVSKYVGHYYLPKKYEKLMDANIKYIALINPLDRKLVFWSKTNPGENYVVVRGNLYHYLASELDRFYSGYHFY